jgi:hypothetical protein
MADIVMAKLINFSAAEALMAVPQSELTGYLKVFLPKLQWQVLEP